jgi:hypothetical protein
MMISETALHLCFVDVSWIPIAFIYSQWWAFVNIVMDLKFPLKLNVSFSKKIKKHAVIHNLEKKTCFSFFVVYFTMLSQ